MAYPLFGEYDLIEEERIIIRESSSDGSREGVVKDTVGDLIDINSRTYLKDSNGGDELLNWASVVKLTLLGRGAEAIPEEDIGMFLEKTGGEVSVTRKRKCSWQQDLFNGSGNKILAKGGHQSKMDDLIDEREQRKVIAQATQQKKVNAGGAGAGAGEAGMGTGVSGSTGSSHLSPNWQVNDLDIDLGGDLPNNAYINDALLSLPSLTFKQEAPSPTGAGVVPGAGGSPPRRAPPVWQRERSHAAHTNAQMNDSMPMESNGATCDVHNQNMNTQGPSVCSPNSTYEAYIQSGGQKNTVTSTESNYHDDFRFQYVLAAATSIATKTNEETLTYLNQGQSYEIKLKKLGDLSHYKGKILKSVVKICFHERRLQYMEREQMALWHSERPGERIVEVDVPLSYGLVQVSQPHNPLLLNCVEVLWDPTKDVGIYIKVNCISTEFTAKKHGGEKGVPFRVQVETFLPSAGEDHRLHAAACQIKVFKLKGADRKHKQDREKVQRQARAEQDKYQASCDCTVLSTIPSDALLPQPLLTCPASYSPELCVPGANGNNSALVLGQKQLGNPANAVLTHPALLTTNGNTIKQQHYDQDHSDVKSNSPTCRSPTSILSDLPGCDNGEQNDKLVGLSKDASAAETQAWLACNRFAHHTNTFANFSGADLLRLSRDDIIQICGLADGIRLSNCLHAKRMEPRLTLYVCTEGAVGSGGAEPLYSAVYLHTWSAARLADKLRAAAYHLMPSGELLPVAVVSGNGVRVRLCDDVVRHLRDGATYRLQRVDRTLLLTPTNNATMK